MKPTLLQEERARFLGVLARRGDGEGSSLISAAPSVRLNYYTVVKFEVALAKLKPGTDTYARLLGDAWARGVDVVEKGTNRWGSLSVELTGPLHGVLNLIGAYAIAVERERHPR